MEVSRWEVIDGGLPEAGGGTSGDKGSGPRFLSKMKSTGLLMDWGYGVRQSGSWPERAMVAPLMEMKHSGGCDAPLRGENQEPDVSGDVVPLCSAVPMSCPHQCPEGPSPAADELAQHVRTSGIWVHEAGIPLSLVLFTCVTWAPSAGGCGPRVPQSSSSLPPLSVLINATQNQAHRRGRR